MLTDVARYFRPPGLPGVEVMYARFATHRYPAHLHETWSLGAVDRGCVTFDLEGTRHIAPAGTIIVIPPYAIHTGEPASPLGYDYRAIFLSPAAGPGWLPEPLRARPDHLLPAVVHDQELARRLAGLHRAVFQPGHELEQGERLTAVTAELTGLVAGPRGARLRPRHAGVTRAVDYIQDHWRDDFSLGDLAHAAGLSPYYLIRIFRQHTGVTPSIYRRALRVAAAQRTLKAGRTPARAAAECGFYDQSHLNRHFKAVTGVTPGRYLLAGA